MAETKKKSHGGGSGSSRVFIVEARYNFPTPRPFGRQIFDNRWQRVSFDQHPDIGIHVKEWDWCPHSKLHGFLGHDAAVALAHWFMVNAGGLCIETRLVQIELEYSFSTNELGVGPTMNLTEMYRATKFMARASELGVEGAAAPAE